MIQVIRCRVNVVCPTMILRRVVVGCHEKYSRPRERWMSCSDWMTPGHWMSCEWRMTSEDWMPSEVCPTCVIAWMTCDVWVVGDGVNTNDGVHGMLNYN